MGRYYNCSDNTTIFVNDLREEIESILGSKLVGIYLHGSIALGGFNPKQSDIDLLGVTKWTLSSEEALKLTQLFLEHSSNPIPVEISFLNQSQLSNWEHPSSFDYHYSEFWRDTYKNKLQQETYLNDQNLKDEDLAAHITVTKSKGICLSGEPIKDVFPDIPQEHFVSSILNDSVSCLNNIVNDPVYCTLNLLRFYKYLKGGGICSKLEGGKWGLLHLPGIHKLTIQKVLAIYEEGDTNVSFEEKELRLISNYLRGRMECFCAPLS